MSKIPQILIAFLLLISTNSDSKILRGQLIKAENWAFLARFCFLTENGTFRYNFTIHGNKKDESNVNLLLYYDAPSQWPSVYPSNRSCEDKQSILSYERGQIVPLSAHSDVSRISGCRKVNDSWSVVQCSSYRMFKSARPRWWFIALADCNSQTGLNITYDISLTNGSPGSFWREHFSADEFYILPILIATSIAYVVLMGLSIHTACKLRLRRLLHSTYRLFMLSVVCQFLGISCDIFSLCHRGFTGFDAQRAALFGNIYQAWSETAYTLLMLLLALGFTVTKSQLPKRQLWYITWFTVTMIILQLALFIYQYEVFDPGLVLYIYESPPGFFLMALKVFAWGVFAVCCYRTSRKTTTKFEFYASLFTLGSTWFLFHPMTVLAITYSVDKWVRESVVKGVSLWMIFIGHALFLYVTRPAASNERFPFHIRTCQVVPITVGQSHNYEPRRTATAAPVFTVQFTNGLSGST